MEGDSLQLLISILYLGMHGFCYSLYSILCPQIDVVKIVFLVRIVVLMGTILEGRE
jgi:hypothetical protein